MTAPEQKKFFNRRLGYHLRLTRWWVMSNGLALLLAVGGACLLAAVWVLGSDRIPDPFLVTGLFGSLGLGLIALIINALILPLYKLRNHCDLIARAEEQGQFRNILVAAEEKCRQREKPQSKSNVGQELVARLYTQALTHLEQLKPDQIFSYPHRRYSFVGAGAVIVVWLLMLVLVPTDLSRGLSFLIRPGSTQTITYTGGIFAEKGADYVVNGADLAVYGLDFTGSAGQTVCEVRSGTGLWQEVPAQRAVESRSDMSVPAAYRKWVATIPEVRHTTEWRFRRDDIVSDSRSVKVRHYPLLTEFSAQITPPAYTRLPVTTLERLPSEFEVPAGSLLSFSGRVNHPLVTAEFVRPSAGVTALSCDSLAISGQTLVDSTLVFKVVLTDKFGLNNESPMKYTVVATADEKPLINLSRPQDDGILPVAGEFELVVQSADDYGLATLSLKVKAHLPGAKRIDSTGNLQSPDLLTTNWSTIRFWTTAVNSAERAKFGPWLEMETELGKMRLRVKRTDDQGTDLRAAFKIEVQAGDLDLVSGDALILLVEAVDNKSGRHPNKNKSRELRLVLPSAADVLTEQATIDSDRRDALQEMRKRGQELSVDLDRLTRELLKNPLPDWARQKEMESAIQRQGKLQQELTRIADQLRQNLDSLARNQLTSPEMLQKADELSQILQQSQSDKLSELLNKLEDSTGQVSPEEIARAIAEVAKNQKDMARKMDAALAMLKQMNRDQELEGMTSLLARMIQQQQELADKSRELAEKQEQAPAASDSESSQDGEPQDGDSDEDSNNGKSDDAKSDDAKSDDTKSDDATPESSEEGQNSSESSEGSEQADEESLSAEELARRQEALADELEQLQEKIAEANKNLQDEQAAGDKSPGAEQMQQALEQVMEKLKEQQNKGKMDQASEQLMEMDPQAAAELQEQALRDLGSLYHVLLQTQESMQMAMSMNQVSSLRGLAADLLALSARQEEIYLAIPPSLRDFRSIELTRSQHRLQKTARGIRDRLSALMVEAPARIIKLLEKVDALIEEMGYGVQAMENNRAPVARRQTQASLAKANQIVIGLLTEAQMSSGSSSGSGSPQQQTLGQKLKELAQKQAGLNGATDELRRMLANRGLSQQVRSEMKRLGGAQGDLAGRMSDIAEEERLKPEGERILGDLSELAGQMEQITGDIDGGLVSEETLIRQERILSRMLDAHNSVRQRDFSSRREGQLAAQLYRQQDGTSGLIVDQERQNPFKLRYLPLEKAPVEYRDLVRLYFSALDSLSNLETQFPTPGGNLP